LGQNHQQQTLVRFYLVVDEGEGPVERTYLISGYQLDPAGNLHLQMNGQVVASFARYAWTSVRRHDFHPVAERVLGEP